MTDTVGPVEAWMYAWQREPDRQYTELSDFARKIDAQIRTLMGALERFVEEGNDDCVKFGPHTVCNSGKGRCAYRKGREALRSVKEDEG